MSFDYHYGDRYILSNISFSLRADETVAVVGALGSGKSTLLMLLARLYDPCSGKIWPNTSEGRQNLHDIRLEAFRRRVGTVFGDASLFTSTVAENIVYDHPQATADNIRRAAAVAGASDSINALPRGFDSLLTERGTDLSGGQRQRIVLARALTTVPDVLIPDDTTSAVDAITETEINTALGRYADEGHMLLVIVRRCSTLQPASRVAVLDKGRMMDTGTPAELEAHCPAFRALMTGDSDFLATPYNSHNELWPTEPATQDDVTDTGDKGFAACMTRMPENAVQ